MPRPLLLLAVATLALAACGDEEAQHGPVTTEAEHSAAGHGEEIGGSHGEAARGPGATDAHDLELELVSSGHRTGRGGDVAFRILDAAGEPVTRFDVEHTKQVHLIVVSRDLARFHHVHPRVTGDGTWRADVRFLDPGPHRVIADVKHEGRRLALTADLEVGGEPRAVGQPVAEARFVAQRLRAGQPATLAFEAPRTQPYLGAAGHLVILSEGDLEYLHVHPHEDALRFQTTFPKPGRYVMFLEYQRDGEVRLARFPVTVG